MEYVYRRYKSMEARIQSKHAVMISNRNLDCPDRCDLALLTCLKKAKALMRFTSALEMCNRAIQLLRSAQESLSGGFSCDELDVQVKWVPSDWSIDDACQSLYS